MSEADAIMRDAGESLRHGSKSFNAAAMLLDPESRDSARLLYAWCRHLDDVVDGQSLGHGRVAMRETPKARLDALRAATIAAHRGEAQDDPVFEAFRRVSERHAIPLAEALALVDGFAMDVAGRQYRTIEDTLDYCYHVAGVVGLMMGRVLGVTDERILDRACDLGLAFQLTNIARDIVEDWRMGRIYVPATWLDEAGLDPARLGRPENREALSRVAIRLLDAAEPYYASAEIGVAALPTRSAWAIGTARGVYRAIGRRIRQAGARAWDERAVVPGRAKARLALAAGVTSLTGAFRRPQQAVRSDELWSRPC